MSRTDHSPPRMASLRRLSGSRHGLSLLEIMLALVILGLTIAAITPLQSSGVRAGLQASLETEAQLRCQAILKERIAQRQFVEQPAQPFVDDHRWRWQVEVSRKAIPQLMELRVIVEHDSSNIDGRIRCAITQLVHTGDVVVQRNHNRRRLP
jgi:prepilin-type N-terminal cleavage/methylation domain-containing protein